MESSGELKVGLLGHVCQRQGVCPSQRKNDLYTRITGQLVHDISHVIKQEQSVSTLTISPISEVLSALLETDVRVDT